VPEYVVGRRTTHYETAWVRSGSREEAVALTKREGAFAGAFEEAEYDVVEAARVAVVGLDGRRACAPGGVGAETGE